jgi:hypothetical protein
VPKKGNKTSTKPSTPTAKLNWQEFTLLENLLVYCVVEDGCAPPESGVEFRINSPTSDEIICVLFEIDRKENDPLIKEGLRPDYMSLHVSSEACICTIIELKGRAEDNLEHGVNQILRLRDILREEFTKHLPTKLKKKIKFQGIILSPPNSNIPLPRIKREEKKGFVILPLQYHHKAELYRYISTAHKKAEGRYTHAPMPHNPEHGFLEGLLTENAVHYRVKDSFYTRYYTKENFYINYVLSKAVYVALAADKNTALIGVKEAGNAYQNKIRDGMIKLSAQTVGITEIE